MHEKQKEEAQADESRGERCCRHADAIPFVINAINQFIINPLKHYNYDNESKQNNERE